MFFLRHSVYMNFADLLPRCMECRRGLAMRILSVRPSVCLSLWPNAYGYSAHLTRTLWEMYNRGSTGSEHPGKMLVEWARGSPYLLAEPLSPLGTSVRPSSRLWLPSVLFFTTVKLTICR